MTSNVTITISRFCRNDPGNTDGPFEDDGGNSFSVDCDADGICDADEIAANPAFDCDLDGALDACELGSDLSLDCNGNGRLDACDVASGAEDKNGNAVPDTCEFAVGDFDLNGVVGAADLAVLLGFWASQTDPSATSTATGWWAEATSGCS